MVPWNTQEQVIRGTKSTLNPEKKDCFLKFLFLLFRKAMKTLRLPTGGPGECGLMRFGIYLSFKSISVKWSTCFIHYSIRFALSDWPGARLPALTVRNPLISDVSLIKKCVQDVVWSKSNPTHCTTQIFKMIFSENASLPCVHTHIHTLQVKRFWLLLRPSVWCRDIIGYFGTHASRHRDKTQRQSVSFRNVKCIIQVKWYK